MIVNLIILAPGQEETNFKEFHPALDVLLERVQLQLAGFGVFSKHAFKGNDFRRENQGAAVADDFLLAIKVFSFNKLINSGTGYHLFHVNRGKTTLFIPTCYHDCWSVSKKVWFLSP